MNNVKLLIAGSAFFAMSAQAADRVSIDVKVTLEAAACTPILSNGGVVNFGSHSVDWPPESPDNQYHLNK